MNADALELLMVTLPADLPRIVERPAWQRYGACADVDTEVFFPERGGDGGAEAKAICAGCPVLRRCLNYALADPHLHGVWGATTGQERKRMRSQRHKAA